MKNFGDIFKYLIKLAENVAEGIYEAPDELFELTGENYPEEVKRLAEAFGIMLVKVEAREFLLEKTIRELKRSKNELELAKSIIEKQNFDLKTTLRKEFSPQRILGISKPIKELQNTIKKIADTPVNVLITGESGTGKELVAKSIHFSSVRANEPFIAINCGALPETLIESELFGIERGVATGVEKRAGKLELAGNGTIFLDEIGEMSLNAQVKLLRALQEKVIERIGSNKPIKINARIIAATNKNLLEEIKKGKFREDLYYRLKVIHINIPPLRERKEDIPLLFNTFLEMYSKKYGRMIPFTVRKDTMDILMKYPWPGNIRELENEAERIVVLAHSNIITPDMLSQDILNYRDREDEIRTEEYNEEVELIKKALKMTNGNKTAAAKLLGISREGLRKKMIRLGMVKPSKSKN